MYHKKPGSVNRTVSQIVRTAVRQSEVFNHWIQPGHSDRFKHWYLNSVYNTTSPSSSSEESLVSSSDSSLSSLSSLSISGPSPVASI